MAPGPPTRALAVLLDLIDLICEESVSFSMNAYHRIPVGSFGQTENLSGGRIHPVFLVTHAVLTLSLQVLPMRLGNRLGRHALKGVNIQEESHYVVLSAAHAGVYVSTDDPALRSVSTSSVAIG